MKQSIILMGLKSSGKSTVGKQLAGRLKRRFIDTDKEIEKRYAEEKGKKLSFQEIYKDEGEVAFKQVECAVVQSLVSISYPCVVATGGSTLLNDENSKRLAQCGELVYLEVGKEVLLTRWAEHPPSFVSSDNLKASLEAYCEQREAFYKKLATIIIDANDQTPRDIVNDIVARLHDLAGM